MLGSAPSTPSFSYRIIQALGFDAARCLFYPQMWEGNKKKGGGIVAERKRLTVKQEKFCLAYVEKGNATQAAIDAGYSKRSARAIGTETLQNPAVRARVEALLQEIQNEKIADATEVLQFLTACMRGQVEEETVVVELIGDGMGSAAKIIKKKIGGREKVKAGELMAKRHGLLTDKLDVNIPVTVVIEDDYGD